MSVQIILKYGNGEPALNELAMGEIGVDITGKSLWTYSQSENKNIQLSGGEVDLGQLPDVDIGNGNYVTLGELALIVGGNQEDIAQLKLDVQANTDGVSANTTSISTLSEKVAALEIWQSDHDQYFNNLLIELNKLEARVTLNETNISTNADDIAALEAEIGLIEAGLLYAGNYDTSTNLISSVSDYAASPPLSISPVSPLSAYVGDSYKGLFFIATVAGTLQNSGGDASQDGQQVYVGDWLICDGTKYMLANYQMESVSFEQIAGDPYDNTALEAALNAKISRDGDVVEGGTYTPALPYVNRND